jgi:hypothetical protein
MRVLAWFGGHEAQKGSGIHTKRVDIVWNRELVDQVVEGYPWDRFTILCRMIVRISRASWLWCGYHRHALTMNPWSFGGILPRIQNQRQRMSSAAMLGALASDSAQLVAVAVDVVAAAAARHCEWFG